MWARTWLWVCAFKGYKLTPHWLGQLFHMSDTKMVYLSCQFSGQLWHSVIPKFRERSFAKYDEIIYQFLYQRQKVWVQVPALGELLASVRPCWWLIGAHSWPLVVAAAAAKSLQSCLTLCNPRDGSPPGSPVPGILQVRTLEWVAISFSNAWKWKGKVKSLSSVRLLATPWTAAYQAPPSVRFSRQEHWNGLPLPSPHGP